MPGSDTTPNQVCNSVYMCTAPGKSPPPGTQALSFPVLSSDPNSNDVSVGLLGSREPHESCQPLHFSPAPHARGRCLEADGSSLLRSPLTTSPAVSPLWLHVDLDTKAPQQLLTAYAIRPASWLAAHLGNLRRYQGEERVRSGQ
ncbi:hypothetical protein NDU88_009272 [Pleurodeles waltl]|uniref:Uncharacterized protein n=1 Tax=Pleurodeles waltl TaxID=8319 RepID=A0AAV7PRR5_PLEWA|nr:hypothetical protein NDU88_009272 [Pleurodeles waltl]